MRFSSIGFVAGLAACGAAEDLLFVDTFKFEEYTEATTQLSYTAKVVTENQWRAMTTADFAAFKAIIISDPDCGRDINMVKYLDDTKAVWGPAIQGNIILIGTDPTLHFAAQPGAKTLIDNAVKFAASGKSTSTGASLTGLYFSLSCYYDTIDTGTVSALSYFGDFGVRGNLMCYQKSHIVASSPAIGTLTDDALSNWGCSVHEAFSRYPSTGVNGFQALAIAKDIIGEGSQTFAGGVVGLPYILSRGATPDGCGDGKWDPALGEECDDGNVVNGDGCSLSCKCESGKPDGKGKCLPPDVPSAKPIPYRNSTVTVTTSIFPPYVTPTVPTINIIIGIEIIIFITIVEDCTTIGGSTITNYITSTCSTANKPIYSSSMPGYPCYVCALSSEGYKCPSSSFITATTTTCISSPTSYTHTPSPPVINTCHSCSPITLATCPTYTPEPTVYSVIAPTLSPHSHAPTAPYTPAPYLPAVPTYTDSSKPTGNTSPAPFTGGATAVAGHGIALFAAVGGIVLGALMVL